MGEGRRHFSCLTSHVEIQLKSSSLPVALHSSRLHLKRFCGTEAMAQRGGLLPCTSPTQGSIPNIP